MVSGRNLTLFRAPAFYIVAHYTTCWPVWVVCRAKKRALVIKQLRDCLFLLTRFLSYIRQKMINFATS